jgi:hypothetical protein
MWIQTNSDGMRDRERAVSRPADTLRIAVLGASEVEGPTVPLEATFEAVMERSLEESVSAHGKRVEVLNFGVPGYTFSQEYLTLQHQVWKYDPQIVMLAVSGFEILKNTRALYPGNFQGTPFYRIENGRLLPDGGVPPQPDPRREFWKNRISDWVSRSNLLCLLNRAVRGNLMQQVEQLKTSLGHSAPAAATAGPPPNYFSTWPYLANRPEMQEAWSIAEAFLDEFKRECDRHHAEFWFIILDQYMQTHPDLDERAAFARQLGVTSLNQTDNRFERYCAERKISTIALAAQLGEYAASHRLRVRGVKSGEGHWNELGHQVVAGILKDTLIAKSPAVKLWTAQAGAN